MDGGTTAPRMALLGLKSLKREQISQLFASEPWSSGWWLFRQKTRLHPRDRWSPLHQVSAAARRQAIAARYFAMRRSQEEKKESCRKQNARFEDKAAEQEGFTFESGAVHLAQALRWIFLVWPGLVESCVFRGCSSRVFRRCSSRVFRGCSSRVFRGCESSRVFRRCSSRVFRGC